MSSGLNYLLNTGTEIWAFTKAPKIVAKRGGVRFQARGGNSMNITKAWRDLYQGFDLYAGIVYECRNVIKSFAILPEVLDLAVKSRELDRKYVVEVHNG